MPKLVLVVDDEPLIVETLAEFLGWEGHEVIRASDGVEALEQIAARKPDLVLIDLMMPRKDGLSAIRELRAQEATASLPIVLMTAAAPAGNYDAVLIKPFKVAALRSALAMAEAAHRR